MVVVLVFGAVLCCCCCCCCCCFVAVFATGGYEVVALLRILCVFGTKILQSVEIVVLLLLRNGGPSLERVRCGK